MSRLIDADALEKEGWSLHRTIRVDKNTEEYQTKPLKQIPTIEPERKIHFADAGHVWIDGKQYISLGRFQEAVVEEQPERKTGRWEDEGNCSVCGHCDWDCTESKWFKFCPNCGSYNGGGA